MLCEICKTYRFSYCYSCTILLVKNTGLVYIIGKEYMSDLSSDRAGILTRHLDKEERKI